MGVRVLWSKDREVEVTSRRLCKTCMWLSVEGAACKRTAELEGIREAAAEGSRAELEHQEGSFCLRMLRDPE